ncbi:hypothetical protein CHARACLAT_001243 [Characodon lateralis]|uniref:Uncharacterized protein n=1 Tax=Characodon lateralis TaxID=208331 RepID=A0ABU7EZM0_9TELE|nr:hypothetical protein [Characodon lateralis]
MFRAIVKHPWIDGRRDHRLQTGDPLERLEVQLLLPRGVSEAERGTDAGESDQWRAGRLGRSRGGATLATDNCGPDKVPKET